MLLCSRLEWRVLWVELLVGYSPQFTTASHQPIWRSIETVTQLSPLTDRTLYTQLEIELENGQKMVSNTYCILCPSLLWGFQGFMESRDDPILSLKHSREIKTWKKIQSQNKSSWFKNGQTLPVISAVISAFSQDQQVQHLNHFNFIRLKNWWVARLQTKFSEEKNSMKSPHIITSLNISMEMFVLMLNILDLFLSFCYGNVLYSLSIKIRRAKLAMTESRWPYLERQNLSCSSSLVLIFSEIPHLSFSGRWLRLSVIVFNLCTEIKKRFTRTVWTHNSLSICQ